MTGVIVGIGAIVYIVIVIAIAEAIDRYLGNR